ncbi:MAG TPA: PilZ domain-containing protein [Vicinamibacterales bacterium]|nr:PilZ domain-containing protein [Vicinamibacterales bacterium]
MTDGTERRRAPRVDLVGQLQGELVSVDLPIRVREISLGGMSIETTEAFAVDTRHSFVLTLGDGAGVFVLGRVAYSRKLDQDGGAIFVTGIQFLDEDAGDAGGDVEDIVRKVH